MIKYSAMNLSSFKKDVQVVGRALVLFFALLVVFTSLNAQSTGDYRSISSGNYTTLSTWQRWSGTTWLTPSTAQGYPGQNTGTGVVTIQQGHQVTVSNAGITTQPMGKVVINNTGRLYLTGNNQPVDFSFNTPEIDITSGGSVYFFNKSVLVLPQNASISVFTGGLVGDGCNANKLITIGSIVYAQCTGGPSSVYNFDELMSAGGTLNAVPTATSYSLCSGASINLIGDYDGYVESPANVQYSWSVVAPGGAVSTISSKDVTINNAVVGQYRATLTVSTIRSGATYSDSETILINVNSLPTLGGATQPITACPGSGAVVQLTGLLPNTTFEVYYSISGGTSNTVTGLVSSSEGTSSFATVPLTIANRGQTLQITGIKITNPASNCSSVFASSVTLSVWQENGSNWVGSVSADWHTAVNWCGGIPTESSDVYINAKQDASYFYPVISTSNAISRNLNLASGASLSISGNNTLELKGNWSNAGSFTTTSGTVSFNGTSAQTLTGSTTFHHLTVSNSSGLTSLNDITVNGELKLTTANPSTTKGSLDMWNGSEIKTLTMGASAVNLGIGDVTGRILRTSLTSEQTYTFGHPNTSIRFYNGTAPSTLRFITKIGATHPKKSNTVKRFYELIKSGGENSTRFSLQLHYLEGELNENIENNLVYWDHHIPYPGISPHEHGKSSQDTELNTIVLSGHSIGYIVQNEYNGEIEYDPENPTYVNYSKIWMISGKEAKSDYVWLGAYNSNWSNVSNWSGGMIPGNMSDVIIPHDSVYSHPLILSVDSIYNVGSIAIEQGAVMTAGAGSVLNVHGDLNYNNGNASWQNQGSFIPGTGTVVFHGDTAAIAGETNFYNLTIDASANLNLLNGSVTRVSNIFTSNGGLVTYLDGPTLFGYNGELAQSVVLPDDSYYHLELTGGGTKTLPTGNLNIKGDLTLSAPTVFTGNTLNLNGTTLQTISGTQTLELNNLGINNAAGVILASNQSIDGELQLTNGLLTTAESVVLNMTCDASFTGGGADSYVNGKLSRTYCETGIKTFPIGKGGYYRPLTYELTALTGASSTVVAEQIEQGLPGFPGSLSADYMIGNRYWSLSQAGASAFSYKLSLDGTPDAPGFVDPKIVRNNTGSVGGTLTAYDASFTTPLYVSPVITDNTLGAFTYGVQCSAPTIYTQPEDVAACDGSDAVIEVIAGLGDLSFSWQMSLNGVDYADITEDETYSVVNSTLAENKSKSVLTIQNADHSLHNNMYRTIVGRTCGSSVASDAVTLTVNDLPYIEPAISEACAGDATVLLSYTNVSGNPDSYQIDWNTEANTAGFVDVTEWHSKVFGSSGTIALSVPTSVEGSYGGTVYLKSSALCLSEPILFTITLNLLPQGSLSGGRTCSGSTGTLTWNATSGTGPFTVIYKNPSNVEYTATGVVTGVPFQTAATQTATTTYTLVSVSGTKGCPRTTDFTVASADIIVESGLWTGAISTNWHDADNWCGGVPTITTDVYIPSDATRQPVISAVGAVCNDIVIESAAIVSISGDYQLTVDGLLRNTGRLDLGEGSLVLNASATVDNYGEFFSARPTGSSLPAGKDWTSGAGLVYLKGATAQSIPSGTFHDLVVDNTAGVSLLEGADVKANNSLQIYNGKMTIGSGRRVETELLSNYVGATGLVINGTSSDASPLGTLIYKNSVDNPVQATVQMFTKAYYDAAGPTGYKYKWQFFGIPVRTTTASPTFNGSYLRVYDETKLKPASQWANLANGSLLEAYKAYEITQNSPKTLTFKGELVNENKTIQLTYTEGGNYPGQNLLANPYTVALRIGNMSFGPATEATIYLYNTGSYSDWTSGGSGGVGEYPGQYVSIPKNIAASENPPTGLPLEIPTMQAFLLKKLRLNTDSLEHFYVNLDYSTMTANNTNPQRIRKEETVEPNPFTSVEVKGARYSDKMWIFTVEGCSRGFDNGWDGPKMWGGAAAPQIYAAEEDGNYQVNSVDDIDESYLGFRPGEDSFYSLTFTHDHLSGKSKQGIYLVDLLTSEITDITASPSVVQFNAEPMSLATKRFKIVTGRNPRVIEKKQESKVEILNISGKLFIDNKSGIVGEVVIHNLNGLPVYSDTFKGVGRTPINTKLKQGVYTVTASTTQETVTQTVVLEK